MGGGWGKYKKKIMQAKMPEKKSMQTETDGKKSFLQKETVDLQGKMFKNCTAK